MKAFKKYLAEFIGTFVLVLFACGTAAVVKCDTLPGYLLTALAFGLVMPCAYPFPRSSPPPSAASAIALRRWPCSSRERFPWLISADM